MNEVDRFLLMSKYPSVMFYGEVSIKENVRIGHCTKIGEFVVIGENTVIGELCSILYHVTICKDAIIGDGVFIGPNVSLLNDKYPPTKVSHAPIIEDHVIIGGGSTILPNVKIGHGSVIGAGSVVTKNVLPNIVVFGNPAHDYISRKEYDKKQFRGEA